MVSLLTYGVMSVAMKQAGGKLGWARASAVGMGVEALLVGTLALWFLGRAEPLQSRAAGGWAWAVLIGVMSVGGFLGFLKGCETAPVSVVQAAVSAGTLVVVAVIGAAFLGERLTVTQWAGVGLSAVAILLLTYGGKQG